MELRVKTRDVTSQKVSAEKGGQTDRTKLFRAHFFRPPLRKLQAGLRAKKCKAGVVCTNFFSSHFFLAGPKVIFFLFLFLFYSQKGLINMQRSLVISLEQTIL